MKFCIKANEPIIQQVINWHFADYHLVLKDPQRAIEILKSNIFDVETNQYQALIAGFYDLLAQSHLALESYSEAEMYAQKLLNTEEQHRYQSAITDASKVLTEVNEYQNNYEQAFFYYKKYSESNKIELDQKSDKLLSIQNSKTKSHRKKHPHSPFG
jgi:tetratricopeptide (TPR) repeat protein